MPLTNAEKQAAWRFRREQELRNLQIRVYELEKKLRNLAQQAKRKQFHLDPAKRRLTAYHEAGHAVIGLAVQLPIAYACSVPNGRKQVGHVAMANNSTLSIGPGYRLIDGRYKRTVGPKAMQLDAFGNVPRKVKLTEGEHHARILWDIAGPMAEARILGDAGNWHDKASNSDKRGIAYDRSELGDAAKPPEQYEREARALVDKYWPMIEAVATRLMQVEWIGGGEVEDICARVVRNGYAKKLRNRTGADHRK
jgi:hypothetical protein